MISYIQFSRSRKNKFDLITGFETTKKQLRVFKAVRHTSAEKFLDSMTINYEKLVNSNFPIEIVKPKKSNGKVYFDFIQGDTIGQLIETAVKSGNETLVKKILDKYIDVLNSLSIKSPIKLKECNEFFGIDFSSEKSWINTGLLDLDTGNIILKESKYYLIDYEWVFDFAIPTNYVIFRALNGLYIHYLGGKNLYSEYVAKQYQKYLNENYIKAEHSFQSYVRNAMEPYQEFLDNHLNYKYESYKPLNYIGTLKHSNEYLSHELQKTQDKLNNLKKRKVVKVALKLARIKNKVLGR